MVGDADHAVGIGQRSVEVGHAYHLHAVVLEGGCVRGVIGDMRAFCFEQEDS